MTRPIAERLRVDAERPSVTDRLVADLRSRIMTLELAPGEKISEIEIAKQAGVSRQPVRDAFYRLSQLGFLTIRPQRGTKISLISAQAIREARFVRTALELETVRVACETFGPSDLAALDEVIDRQKRAVDAGEKSEFHELDDAFHRTICERGGLGFTWQAIRQQKAHSDRVRFLSLSFATEQVLHEHGEILAAIRERDQARAAEATRVHLGRINGLLAQFRDSYPQYFKPE